MGGELVREGPRETTGRCRCPPDNSSAGRGDSGRRNGGRRVFS